MLEEQYLLIAISCGVMSYMMIVWSSIHKKNMSSLGENSYYDNNNSDDHTNTQQDEISSCSWRRLFGCSQSKLDDEENPSLNTDKETACENCDTVVEMDPEIYDKIWWG